MVQFVCVSFVREIKLSLKKMALVKASHVRKKDYCFGGTVVFDLKIINDKTVDAAKLRKQLAGMYV